MKQKPVNRLFTGFFVFQSFRLFEKSLMERYKIGYLKKNQNRVTEFLTNTSKHRQFRE
ncbi:hypothetical protein FEDK69T_18930 [Flavobacterium enshiense DK69]|nr:hypothetical protein FEDK69T_18930 [Flavobacterium enshiense DK69]